MSDVSKQAGKIIIVSGPSGVGKGTILRRLYKLNEFPLTPSISATTRKPRHGEQDGKDYHFLSPDEFAAKKANGEFLECFEVFAGGHWYGTLRAEVEKSLKRNEWVVLEIDVKGAREVLKTYPDAVTVFIAPPDLDTLAGRLTRRGTEDAEALRRRLGTADEEMRHCGEYKHVVVNGQLDDAVRELRAILTKELQ